ncbi:MAG: TSUP family transporter [Alphaproteobacteria bacterium]|nr:TSUP family transporter [Alphaproteobacteria bacterium]MCB1651899.1 TSUP family transporter [Alphaproteobacteria bacterium]
MDSLIFLIPLSFVMGFVNSIAGGGGVLGVPSMIAIGIPPINALALNRISDTGNIVGSLNNYMRVDNFDRKLGLIAIPPIIIGAFIGANLIVGIEKELLNKIIVGAVMIGVFFLVYPFNFREEKAKPHIAIGIIALLLLGLWDGAFAMAGGTFGVLIFVLLFHKSFLSAKGVMTFAAIPETLMSATILYLHSSVKLDQMAVMFLAAVVGAFVGSKIAIKKGSRFIRYAMAAMAIVMVSKILLFDVLMIF